MYVTKGRSEKERKLFNSRLHSACLAPTLTKCDMYSGFCFICRFYSLCMCW